MMLDKVYVGKSSTADTRTCDVSTVSKEQLWQSSISHKKDVLNVFRAVIDYLLETAELHDCTKLTRIDWFHEDFKSAFKTQGWWDMHRTAERHHISELDGVPIDINLFDVLEHLIDNVTACVARTGEKSNYRYSMLDSDVLKRAVANTEAMLLECVTPDWKAVKE